MAQPLRVEPQGLTRMLYQVKDVLIHVTVVGAVDLTLYKQDSRTLLIQ